MSLGDTRTEPTKILEVFDNPHPDVDYVVTHHCTEFSCLCPKTGQPDFASIYIEFVPGARCVETKSLKLYLWSFRDEGHFHEDMVNTIAKDLRDAMKPKRLKVVGKFNVRGGIHSDVTVELTDLAPG